MTDEARPDKYGISHDDGRFYRDRGEYGLVQSQITAR